MRLMRSARLGRLRSGTAGDRLDGVHRRRCDMRRPRCGWVLHHVSRTGRHARGSNAVSGLQMRFPLNLVGQVGQTDALITFAASHDAIVEGDAGTATSQFMDFKRCGRLLVTKSPLQSPFGVKKT